MRHLFASHVLVEHGCTQKWQPGKPPFVQGVTNGRLEPNLQVAAFRSNDGLAPTAFPAETNHPKYGNIRKIYRYFVYEAIQLKELLQRETSKY